MGVDCILLSMWGAERGWQLALWFVDVLSKDVEWLNCRKGLYRAETLFFSHTHCYANRLGVLRPPIASPTPIGCCVEWCQPSDESSRLFASQKNKKTRSDLLI